MVQYSSQSVGPIAVWFFRLIGPAVLASLLLEQFVVAPGDPIYQSFAGPLYMLAWVGAFLVFLDTRGRQPKFALPFLLIVLAIAALAVAALVPMLPAALPSETQLYARVVARDVARVVHGLAAIAFTAIGWTSRVPLRTRP